MLLNFIATNEEEALWVSFSDGNGTRAGALFLKKKKLLAHGTLLHFGWTAPKGPMNWIIHVGDWCHPFYDGVYCIYGSHHEVCSFLVWPFAKDPPCWSCMLPQKHQGEDRDWKIHLQHPSLSTTGLHHCDARYTSFATCSTLVPLIKWSNNTVKIERVSSLSFHFQCR